MTSAPRDRVAGLYQTQCIRNPRQDDIDYMDLAPTEAAKVRLRRAYIVAGVLFGANLLAAVCPIIYVASTLTSMSRLDVVGSGNNWTVCWPCRSSPRKKCCATLATTDLSCNTIIATSDKTASCWPDDSYHLVLKESGKTCSDDSDKPTQLRGWVRPSRWTSSFSTSVSPMDNITVKLSGIYMIYSKITFGCDRNDVFTSIPHSYQHKIEAVDGKGGRSNSIAELQRGQSARNNKICYSSFLAVAVELHRNDSVYVVVKPCNKVKQSPTATQFGVFRIG